MSQHPFNTAPGPEADIPLREKLPNFSATTCLLLVEWGSRQPAALPWLLQRAAEYWDGPADGGPADGGPADGGPADGGPADGASASQDSQHLRIEATAALDLLRWQSGCETDLAAVVRLRDIDEAAREFVKS